jgi:hypothetical protein
VRLENYGNDQDYIVARLERDGFDRLALSVRYGRLSASFARELAATVPREHLDAMTDIAERFGPRRPEGWRGWQEELAAFGPNSPKENA